MGLIRENTMAASSGKARKWFRWALELTLLIALVVGIQFWRTQDAAKGLAPNLDARLVDGGEFSLSTAPRPMVVHFWATWCPVCSLGQGSIDSLAREGRVVTIALSSGTDAEIRRHLSGEGISFPVINDGTGTIASQWGVNGVPASFIVDSNGEIRFATSGHTTAAGLRTRLWLAERDS